MGRDAGAICRFRAERHDATYLNVGNHIRLISMITEKHSEILDSKSVRNYIYGEWASAQAAKVTSDLEDRCIELWEPQTESKNICRHLQSGPSR